MFDEKRILTVFFCLGILVCIVFSFSACNLSDLGSQDDSHTHTLVKHEAKSATCTDEGNVEYWHCEKCGKNFSDKDGISEVAGVAIPSSGHTYSSEWSKDDDYHWHAATCEHTEEINGKAPHTFDVDNLCTVCGYLKIEATPDSYFAFTLLPDGTYEIKAKDNGNLPQTIRLPSYYNGQPATSNGDSAFAGCNITNVTFENTSGWKVSDSSSFVSYNNISSVDLANTSTAAKYLRDTYCSYYWERS